MKFKNYIILLVFYVLTVLCVLYLCKIYSNSSSVRSTFVSDYALDITDSSYDKIYNNVLNFSEENEGFVIYISSYKDDDVRSFEKKFINAINEKNLKNKVLFVNSSNLSKFSYINDLIHDFGCDSIISKRDLPIFVIINDKKVLSIKSVSQFDYDSLKNLLGDIYD